MQPHPDRGSILIADVVVGALIVVILGAAAAAVGTWAGTDQANREAARSAARVLLREGDFDHARRVAERLAPGSAVATESTGGTVRVTVVRTVELPHPVSSRSATSSVAVELPVAPYRSNRE